MRDPPRCTMRQSCSCNTYLSLQILYYLRSAGRALSLLQRPHEDLQSIAIATSDNGDPAVVRASKVEDISISVRKSSQESEGCGGKCGEAWRGPALIEGSHKVRNRIDGEPEALAHGSGEKAPIKKHVKVALWFATS